MRGAHPHGTLLICLIVDVKIHELVSLMRLLLDPNISYDKQEHGPYLSPDGFPCIFLVDVALEIQLQLLEPTSYT